MLDVSGTEHFHMMDWWTDIFGQTWWLVMGLSWIIYFAVSITLAFYVHKDAVRRGIHNSEVWLFVTLIFNVIGALVYFLVRKNYNFKDSQIR